MTRIYLAGILATVSIAAAAAPTDARTPQIKSPAEFDALNGSQLTPQTLYYSDNVLDFSAWKASLPAEAQALSLYPGYQEPTVNYIKDGEHRQIHELLKIYVAKTKVVLNKPATQINPAGFISLANLSRLDTQVQHRQISAADLMPNVVGKKAITNFNWCNTSEDLIERPKKEIDISYLAGQNFCGAGSLCVESCYAFPGVLRKGVKVARGLVGGGDPVDLGIASQSELRAFASDKDFGQALAPITRVQTPVSGVIVLNGLYLNQLIQFTKIVVVLQPHPDNSAQTVMTTFVVLGVRNRSWVKYGNAALNAVGLSLESILRHGFVQYNEGLAAGVPTYTQNMTKAIAGILEAR